MEKPRYVISRSSKFITDTWLTKILPEVIGKISPRSKKSKLVMYHSVPKILAGRRQDADVSNGIGMNLLVPQSCFTHTVLKARLELKSLISNNGPKNSLHRKSKFSYEQLCTVILLPSQFAHRIGTDNLKHLNQKQLQVLSMLGFAYFISWLHFLIPSETLSQKCDIFSMLLEEWKKLKLGLVNFAPSILVLT